MTWLESLPWWLYWPACLVFIVTAVRVSDRLWAWSDRKPQRAKTVLGSGTVQVQLERRPSPLRLVSGGRR